MSGAAHASLPQPQALLTAEDLGRLSEWMDQQGLPEGTIEELRPIVGGTQNVMLSFRRGNLRCVLRRPPFSKREHSDQTMLREANILRRLGATAVPLPRMIACCEDSRVLACYKLGILLEGTHARSCAGKAPKAVGDALHAAATNLIERALRKISHS